MWQDEWSDCSWSWSGWSNSWSTTNEYDRSDSPADLDASSLALANLTKNFDDALSENPERFNGHTPGGGATLGGIQMSAQDTQILQAHAEQGFALGSALGQRFRRAIKGDPEYLSAQSQVEKANFRMKWLATQYAHATHCLKEGESSGMTSKNSRPNAPRVFTQAGFS